MDPFIFVSDVPINRESVESVFLRVSDRSKMLEISDPIPIIFQ